MIIFEKENNRFNYRVVGIAVHENSVLLHRAEGEDFWTFPGGRAEFGETAEQTLRREMREEIGIEVEVVRLLWLVENFFNYEGKDWHEIAFYFLMRFPPGCKYLVQHSFQGEEDWMKLTFQWFPQQPEVLSSLPLLPSFLQTAVCKLPDSVQHVIHYDELKRDHGTNGINGTNGEI
jgi:mutator protein MutT